MIYERKLLAIIMNYEDDTINYPRYNEVKDIMAELCKRRSDTIKQELYNSAIKIYDESKLKETEVSSFGDRLLDTLNYPEDLDKYNRFYDIKDIMSRMLSDIFERNFYVKSDSSGCYSLPGDPLASITKDQLYLDAVRIYDEGKELTND